MSWARWRWRRWRAAHVVWVALCDWWIEPTDENRNAWLRALDHQAHVWASRP